MLNFICMQSHNILSLCTWVRLKWEKKKGGGGDGGQNCRKPILKLCFIAPERADNELRQVSAGMCPHDGIYTQISVYTCKFKFNIPSQVRDSLLLLINEESSGQISKREK